MTDQAFLITGAYGFIGAWIIKRLLASDTRVVIFDRSADPQRLFLIMDEEQVSRVRVITGDVTDPEALTPIIDEFAVTNIIHLAGVQVPTCRSDPRFGALVNVLGTINVFEAARRSAGQIKNVVYASSAAVFGQSEDDRPMTEKDEPRSTSHYGVFKRCNEGNAHVYFLDHGLNSVGLRPLTVYGVGRDTGLTSDPTKAMKAAAIGRPYHMRFGGSTDFQYVADTADTFIHAARSDLTGAHVFNLHGDTIHIRQVVEEIERAKPEARGTITYAGQALTIPAAMDDSALRAALGPMTVTPLAEGVTATMERFAELERQGRLDTKDLDQ